MLYGPHDKHQAADAVRTLVDTHQAKVENTMYVQVVVAPDTHVRRSNRR